MSVWIRAGGPQVPHKQGEPRYYKYDGQLHFSTATYDCVVLCDENERGSFVELQADRMDPKCATNSFLAMSEVDPLTNRIKPRKLSWLLNGGKGTLVEAEKAYVVMDTFSKPPTTDKCSEDDPFDYVTAGIKAMVETYDEEEEQRKQQQFYEQLKMTIDEVFDKKDRVIREGMTSSGAIKPVEHSLNIYISRSRCHRLIARTVSRYVKYDITVWILRISRIDCGTLKSMWFSLICILIYFDCFVGPGSGQ